MRPPAIAVLILLAAVVACDWPTTELPGPGGRLGALPAGSTMVAGDRSIGPLTDSVYGTLREITNPLVVLVLDRDRVPIRGVRVVWTAFGGGVVTPIDSVTNAGGEAIAEYTFGAEARSGYGAIASVDGLAGSPIVFNLRAHAATPTRLGIVRGDSLTVAAGEKVVYTVVAKDSYGNPTRGVRVEWAATPAGSTPFFAVTYTGTDGRSEVTRRLGMGAGEQAATATAVELVGSPQVRFTTRTYAP